MINLTKEQAARIRKMQAHPQYRGRNLRKEIMIFESPKALAAYIHMLESNVKPFKRPAAREDALYTGIRGVTQQKVAQLQPKTQEELREFIKQHGGEGA